MASIRSFITRFVRATVSHHAATVSHHSATTNTLLHHHHILKPTSPLAFIRSHPFNQRISNHHLFSTFAFQRGATKSRLRRFFDKLMLGMLLIILQICINGVYTITLAKFLKQCRDNLDHEKGTRFKGSVNNFVHSGHAVVIEGYIKPLQRNGVDLGFQYYYIVTEVLSKPDQIDSAMERNSLIIANKGLNKNQNVAEEKKSYVSGEEPEVVIKWRTGRSGEVSNDVANPPKSRFLLKGLVLEGRITQSAAFYVAAKVQIAKLLHDAVKDFKGLSDALREGHSVIIVRSVKPMKHGFEEKEDKWGKRLVVKIWDSECHVFAQVLDKHDEKYMPHNAVSAAVVEE
ncbi:uncharacterized protein LOC141713190 [Apium graveolens]|uniref:uncharacterized protein LOC141713190 n=1 Tax=Apium graveolens TaxID=4045 RepID=UPI003D790873